MALLGGGRRGTKAALRGPVGGREADWKGADWFAATGLSCDRSCETFEADCACRRAMTFARLVLLDPPGMGAAACAGPEGADAEEPPPDLACSFRRRCSASGSVIISRVLTRVGCTYRGRSEGGIAFGAAGGLLPLGAKLVAGLLGTLEGRVTGGLAALIEGGATGRGIG